MTIKHYDLRLPVFKQGDDLSHHLTEHNGDAVKAFIGLADQYAVAAAMCKRTADVLSKINPSEAIDVQADTHCIFLSADENLIKDLVDEEILIEDEWADDEEEHHADEEELN